MQGNLNNPESTDLSPQKPLNRPVRPSTDQRSPDQKPSSLQKRDSLRESQTRKQQATISVLAGGDNTVSDVLERARTLADEELEPEKEGLAQEIKGVLVQTEREQLVGLKDFLFKHRSGDNARLLAAVQPELIDGELLP